MKNKVAIATLIITDRKYSLTTLRISYSITISVSSFCSRVIFMGSIMLNDL